MGSHHLDLPPTLAVEHARDRAKLRALREAIAERIEADIDLLDALDGDPDLELTNEDGGDIQDEPHDEEPDLEDGDDREGDTDDNGIADLGGAIEQGLHPLLRCELPFERVIRRLREMGGAA